jgi:hypothetical protein
VNHETARPLAGPGVTDVDWRRVFFLTVAGVLALWAIVHFCLLATDYHLGGDRELYLMATRRWLSGGGFYEAYQFAGPYTATTLPAPILYPPVAIPFFIPWLVLPAQLWWIIPLGGTAWIVAGYRPGPATLALVMFCLGIGAFNDSAIAGNPAIWVMFAVTLGTRWPALSAMVLLKPSLFPFALFGVRDRRWWILTGVLCAVSLAMLPMDLEWLRAVSNATGDRSGFLYSLREVPMMCIPLIAWAARRRIALPRP